jgi:hypothetical protein
MTRFTVHPGDYAPFHDDYVQLTKDKDIVPFLEQQGRDFVALLSSIPDTMEDYSYASGKWTVRQLVQHVIDTERIFAFRLLAMCRGEQQPIPGFEQEDYAAAVDVSGRSFNDQCREFESVRNATLTLVYSVSETESARKGTVSGHPLAARALPFIIAGHVEHHLNILKSRYSLRE